MAYFFLPRVGKDYQEGLQGVKTLVLGASFYCTAIKCPFRKECIIDSRPFKDNCPSNRTTGKDLSHSCEIEIDSFLDGDDYYTSYENFTALVCESFPNITKEFLWEHIAFYEYLQHFLDTWTTPQYRGHKQMFSNDFEALEQVIKELEPELIVIWGAPVRDAIKDLWPEDIIKLEEEDYNHWTTIYGKKILLYYMHHPSAPQLQPKLVWNDHVRFLRKAIELVKNAKEK